MAELQPHQIANSKILFSALQKRGGALDASSTGTGKTYTFLGLCKQLGARPAIVTRKAILPGWEKACRAMDVEPVFLTNYEQLLSDKFPYGKAVRAATKRVKADGTPIEQMKVKSFTWNLPTDRVLFCFDEAQALRSKKSAASVIALSAFKRYKTVLLSATPFQNPLEAEVIGYVLGLFSAPNYYGWLFRYGCRKDVFKRMNFVGNMPDSWIAGRQPGQNAAEGREHMLRLHSEIFPDRGCRTRHEDIPGFPDTLVCVEAVETGSGDEITALYQQELAELRKRDHDRACRDVDVEFHDLVDVLPVVENLRFRQEIELLKCKAIAEMARLSQSKGRPCAIFVNFDASIEALSQYLDCNCIIRGDGSGKTHPTRPMLSRAHAISEFQSNRQPFILVNNAAGGAGLSLHDDVSQIPRDTLISPPYSAVVLKQILGRTHRLGGGGSVQKILFAHGTVEERVMERVQNNLGNLDALVDGDLVVNG